ncbi:MAG TPA: hypothetical protein VKU19_20885 [Bryobacteraceae bacterium]|nr:hypothetical protein [Bryobacteraceae bacterium]
MSRFGKFGGSVENELQSDSADDAKTLDKSVDAAERSLGGTSAAKIFIRCNDKDEVAAPGTFPEARMSTPPKAYNRSLHDHSSQAAPPVTKDENEPMLYCPVCSSRLAEQKCKLVCPKCSYYLSCADYY